MGRLPGATSYLTVPPAQGAPRRLVDAPCWSEARADENPDTFAPGGLQLRKGGGGTFWFLCNKRRARPREEVTAAAAQSTQTPPRGQLPGSLPDGLQFSREQDGVSKHSTPRPPSTSLPDPLLHQPAHRTSKLTVILSISRASPKRQSTAPSGQSGFTEVTSAFVFSVCCFLVV